MKKLATLIGSFALLCLGATTATAVPTIVVGPGSTPAGGYLPLSAFGITPIGGMGDNTSVDFSVPAFRYAGEDWTSLGVDSNGYVVVGGEGGTSSPLNTNFPSLSNPSNVLAPFWTDLDPSLAGGVRIGTLTDGVSTWIVVDWAGVPLAGNAAALNTFEIWIGLNSNALVEDITYAYGVTAIPVTLTIGAEDKTGTVGSAYYYNGTGTIPGNGGQLRVTTRDLPTPEPASLALLGAGLAGLGAMRRKRKA